MADFINIWRIEDANGRGIYQSYNIGDEYYASTVRRAGIHDHPRAHPLADEDPTLRKHWCALPWQRRIEFFFGFESVEAAGRWFHQADWRTKLARLGGRLTQYRVRKSDVRFGKRQLVFRINRSVRVGVASLKELPLGVKPPFYVEPGVRNINSYIELENHRMAMIEDLFGGREIVIGKR
jgi:hypothetical protein